MADTKPADEVKPAEGDIADTEDVEVEEKETTEIGDVSSSPEKDGTPAVGGNISSEVGALMMNPAVLAAIQDRLGNMDGLSSGYIQSLPKCVKRRIKALKKLQFECTKIEAKFYEEVHLLECKYNSKYTSYYETRKDVLCGTVEPTDSDCDWPSDEEDEEQLAVSNDEAKTKLAIENESGDKSTEKKEEEKDEENTKGIPFFWLTVFKNVDLLADMVQEHDEPILKHLDDIRVTFTDKEPYGFTLHFMFGENEFFPNRELTKEYELRVEPEESDPFSYEGMEIVKCKGCTIDWTKGKNVTVKTIKKTQRHKGRGTKRTITKQVKNDSFFNFFSPPDEAEAENDDEDDDTEALLASDFEIGQFIRERVIPKAVLYFTGEAMDDDDYDDEEEGEEEGEEEEGSEDEDPDYNPGRKAANADCKQQ